LIPQVLKPSLLASGNTYIISPFLILRFPLRNQSRLYHNKPTLIVCIPWQYASYTVSELVALAQALITLRSVNSPEQPEQTEQDYLIVTCFEFFVFDQSHSIWPSILSYHLVVGTTTHIKHVRTSQAHSRSPANSHSLIYGTVNFPFPFSPALKPTSRSCFTQTWRLAGDHLLRLAPLQDERTKID
jgi:hypothetical protein